MLIAPNMLYSLIYELLEGRKWDLGIFISPTKNQPVLTKNKSILLETEKITGFSKNVTFKSKAMPRAGCHPGPRRYLACVVSVRVLTCGSWEGSKAKVSLSLVLKEFAARGLRLWLAGMWVLIDCIQLFK